MKTATIETGKLEAVKTALRARDSWAAYIAEHLHEGTNEVTDEMGETLADVAAEILGLDVE